MYGKKTVYSLCDVRFALLQLFTCTANGIEQATSVQFLPRRKNGIAGDFNIMYRYVYRRGARGEVRCV